MFSVIRGTWLTSTINYETIWYLKAIGYIIPLIRSKNNNSMFLNN